MKPQIQQYLNRKNEHTKANYNNIECEDALARKKKRARAHTAHSQFINTHHKHTVFLSFFLSLHFFGWLCFFFSSFLFILFLMKSSHLFHVRILLILISFMRFHSAEQRLRRMHLPNDSFKLNVGWLASWMAVCLAVLAFTFSSSSYSRIYAHSGSGGGGRASTGTGSLLLTIRYSSNVCYYTLDAVSCAHHCCVYIIMVVMMMIVCCANHRKQMPIALPLCCWSMCCLRRCFPAAVCSYVCLCVLRVLYMFHMFHFSFLTSSRLHLFCSSYFGLNYNLISKRVANSNV